MVRLPRLQCIGRRRDNIEPKWMRNIRFGGCVKCNLMKCPEAVYFVYWWRLTLCDAFPLARAKDTAKPNGWNMQKGRTKHTRPLSLLLLLRSSSVSCVITTTTTTTTVARIPNLHGQFFPVRLCVCVCRKLLSKTTAGPSSKLYFNHQSSTHTNNLPSYNINTVLLPSLSSLFSSLTHRLPSSWVVPATQHLALLAEQSRASEQEQAKQYQQKHIETPFSSASVCVCVSLFLSSSFFLSLAILCPNLLAFPAHCTLPWSALSLSLHLSHRVCLQNHWQRRTQQHTHTHKHTQTYTTKTTKTREISSETKNP